MLRRNWSRTTAVSAAITLAARSISCWSAMRSVSSIRVGSSTSSGRSASCSSTASRSVLEGIVPVWMDTPPRRSLRSATATRLPSFAAWMAAFWPEGPDPMTSMSSSTRVILPDTGARVPSRPIVPVAVLKLGSSVVAHESGDLRLSVVARICEEVAGLHRAGVDVVVVTSGAIARGIRLLARLKAPDRSRRSLLQPAGAAEISQDRYRGSGAGFSRGHAIGPGLSRGWLCVDERTPHDVQLAAGSEIRGPAVSGVR